MGESLPKRLSGAMRPDRLVFGCSGSPLRRGYWRAHLDSNPNGEKILVKTYRRKFSRLFLDGATGEQKSLTPKRPSSPSKRPQKSATVSLFLRGLHVMENFNSILQ